MSSIPEPKPDLFKDTPLRYLGYSNEIGEAFRGYIGSKLVKATYCIATLYVLGDTIDKTIETSKATQSIKQTFYTTIDTFTWQILASVLIPGFTINRICATTNFIIKQFEMNRFLMKQRKFIVTGVGLAVIPFIIKPIDRFVDDIMDKSLRKIAP